MSEKKSLKSFNLQALAEIVGGEIDAAHASVLISGVATPSTAKAGELCFIEQEKYLKYLPESQASAVLMPAALINLIENQNNRIAIPIIKVANPKWAFAQIANLLYPAHEKFKPGIHPSAVIGENTVIDPTAHIGAQCVIGDNCIIGKNVVIHPKVSIYANTTISDESMIHSGVVLGSDGFGFAHNQERWLKIPHIGGVKIGKNVEIGANTTIDRGLIENTIIEDGVIIDNLVHIAHNVHIGAHTAIAACVGIAGSAKIGKHCQIGGGSIINGHITIADYVYFIAGSQVGNSIKKSGVYSSGIPAKEYAGWVKNIARFHQLDAWADRVKALEHKLNNLKIEDGSCG